MPVKYKKNEGSALLMSILMLSGALVIVLLSADIIQSGIKMTRTQAGSVKAYYAAETGAERVLEEVWKNYNYDLSNCEAPEGEEERCINFKADPIACGECSTSIYDVGDSQYYVKVVSGKFIATGKHQSVRRSIQLGFAEDLPEKSCQDECLIVGKEGCSDNGAWPWVCAKSVETGCNYEDFNEIPCDVNEVCEVQGGLAVCVTRCCPFFGPFEDIVFPCEFCP